MLKKGTILEPKKTQMPPTDLSQNLVNKRNYSSIYLTQPRRSAFGSDLIGL